MEKNTNTEKWNIIEFPTEEKKDKEAKKNNNKLNKFLFLISFAFIVGAILFALFSDSSFKSTDSINLEPISILSTGNYDFASYKGGYIYANDGKIFCYNTNQSLQWSSDGSKTLPKIRTNGDYVLTYYCNDNLAVISNGKRTRKIKTDGKVIYGDINSNGYCALIVDEEGFKNQISVYDKDGKSVYKWHNSDKYITSVKLSDNNHSLVLCEIKMKKNNVTSNLLISDIRKNFEPNELDLGDLSICDLKFITKNKFIVLSDSNAQCYSLKKRKKWEINYDERNLITYDISTNNTLALIFGEGDSKLSKSVVEYYNSKGRKIGNFESKTKIESIDMQDNISLISYDRMICIVNIKGKELASKDLNYDIRKSIFMGNKKSALIISGASASLITPE